MQQCDPTDGPIAGPHNFHRGGTLTHYDLEAREAIENLREIIDTDAVTQIWNTALASRWEKPPVWVHGDIALGNLLVKKGQLSGVIDFGLLGIGDPACDLAIAWTLFTPETRKIFQKALSLDENTWARGRGWALWKALINWASSKDLKESKQVISEVLVDYQA